MKNVLGVDPGTKSWDFFGLSDKDVVVDTSIPSKELMEKPQKAIMIIESMEDIDLMVAPSGFGLPLKKVQGLDKDDIFFTLLKFKKKAKDQLLGLGDVLRLIKKADIPGIMVPGVKHLSTVPTYRKINKVDMGTADKLCTSVVGIKHQMERFHILPEKTNFIMVEIGHGFTAVLAVENGQIIDGIGGSNIMGFRACGSLDGELAYLIKNIRKKNIYRGGVSYISGYPDLSIKEITFLAEKDEHVRNALKAYVDDVTKAVYAISSSYLETHENMEILLAGRGAKIDYLRNMLVNSIESIAPVKLMGNYSQIAKRAAQGAAFIANGLLDGEYEPIIDNLKLKEASGSILDDIYIPLDNKELKPYLP
ncbi:MAG: DUF1464 family protein [Promethearchaeia archaeon]